MQMNQDCLIVFVLDKSGSMMMVTEATCLGYNQFMEEQQKVEGETVVTLTLFDTTLQTPFVGRFSTNVPALGSSENPYIPSGMTALFDAVGESIKKTEVWVQENKWQGQVKVVVLTDGAENASRKWHILNPRQDNDEFDLAGLIDWKRGEGWDFVFLGAGGTDWLERTFNTLPNNVFFAYAGDAGSTRATYGTLSASMTSSRASGNSLGSTMQQDPDSNPDGV